MRYTQEDWLADLAASWTGPRAKGRVIPRLFASFYRSVGKPGSMVAIIGRLNTSNLALRFREDGKLKCVALGHRDKNRALRTATKLAESLRGAAEERRAVEMAKLFALAISNRRNRTRARCSNGHPMTAANVYFNRDKRCTTGGFLCCRTCRQERSRAEYRAA